MKTVIVIGDRANEMQQALVVDKLIKERLNPVVSIMHIYKRHDDNYVRYAMENGMINGFYVINISNGIDNIDDNICIRRKNDKGTE